MVQPSPCGFANPMALWEPTGDFSGMHLLLSCWITCSGTSALLKEKIGNPTHTFSLQMLLLLLTQFNKRTVRITNKGQLILTNRDFFNIPVWQSDDLDTAQDLEWRVKHGYTIFSNTVECTILTLASANTNNCICNDLHVSSAGGRTCTVPLALHPDPLCQFGWHFQSWTGSMCNKACPSPAPCFPHYYP